MRAVRKILLVSGAILALTASASYAGPCSTAQRDAGSGKVPGFTGQTTGSTASREHPPTAAMNKAAENTASSSQDTQRQMQGKPTAAKRLRAARRPIRAVEETIADHRKRKGLQLALEPLNGRGIAGYVPKP